MKAGGSQAGQCAQKTVLCLSSAPMFWDQRTKAGHLAETKLGGKGGAWSPNSWSDRVELTSSMILFLPRAKGHPVLPSELGDTSQGCVCARTSLNETTQDR